ncbi:YhzD family protein, partial [Priestia megaterium]
KSGEKLIDESFEGGCEREGKRMGRKKLEEVG